MAAIKSKRRSDRAGARKRYDYFISYNRNDSEQALAIARGLKERGMRVWMDQSNLVPGDEWQKEIVRALRRSNAQLVLIGPSGVGGWQDREIQLGGAMPADRQPSMVPMMLPGAVRSQTIADQLAPFHHRELNDQNFSAQLDALAEVGRNNRELRSQRTRIAEAADAAASVDSTLEQPVDIARAEAHDVQQQRVIEHTDAAPEAEQPPEIAAESAQVTPPIETRPLPVLRVGDRMWSLKATLPGEATRLGAPTKHRIEKQPQQVRDPLAKFLTNASISRASYRQRHEEALMGDHRKTAETGVDPLSRHPETREDAPIAQRARSRGMR